MPEARPIEMPAPGRESTVLTRPADTRDVRTRDRVVPAAARMMHGDFDYSYVMSDLRRIAILAVLFFGAMIALTFVLK